MLAPRVVKGTDGTSGAVGEVCQPRAGLMMTRLRKRGCVGGETTRPQPSERMGVEKEIPG